LRLSVRHAECVGHSHQVDQRPRSHLSHDLAAMDLHRHLAQFRLRGNLIVSATSDNESQNFSLARRQGIEALLQLGNNLGFLPPDTIALDPRLDRIEQFLLAQWLGQEFDGPGFYGSHRHGNVAVPADKYDWKMDVRVVQCTLEFETARPW